VELLELLEVACSWFAAAGAAGIAGASGTAGIAGGSQDGSVLIRLNYPAMSEPQTVSVGAAELAGACGTAGSSLQ
jgi:hypothetical protein